MKKCTFKSFIVVAMALCGTMETNAQVVETYPFSTWEPNKTSTYVVTKSETAEKNSSNVDVYKVTNAFLGHSLNGRFAVTAGSKFEGNKGLLIGAKNNGLSLLNLYEGDIVNINFAAATAGYYLNYNNETLVSETDYTMGSDGSFDITWTTSKTDFRIYNVTIKSRYITIGSTGYATYCNCTDKDVTIKEGEDLKAYIVTSQDGTNV